MLPVHTCRILQLSRNIIVLSNHLYYSLFSDSSNEARICVAGGMTGIPLSNRSYLIRINLLSRSIGVNVWIFTWKNDKQRGWGVNCGAEFNGSCPREECTKVQFSLAAEVDTIRAWWQKALTQVLFNGVSA